MNFTPASRAREPQPGAGEGRTPRLKRLIPRPDARACAPCVTIRVGWTELTST